MKTVILYVGFSLVAGSLFFQGGAGHFWQSDHLARAHDLTDMPFCQEWASSAHANEAARAFTCWETERSQEIPVECAKCHSTPGYQDFIGADGSAAGIVDRPAPLGTVIDCTSCHNDVTLTMDSVIMPSGIEITNLGREARCIQCHQGRASKFSIDRAIAEANPDDPDTVRPELNFINNHYFAAAATKYGTVAKGGYEYQDKSYDAYFAHVDQFDSCVECHESHTLHVRIDQCRTCHPGIETAQDFKDIRMQGSLVDYDGDGNLKEGIYYEIEGLQKMLYRAIQAYAIETCNTAIAYDADTLPYLFIDTNRNGKADPEEANHQNIYNALTARLLKAVYNYHVSVKDPGMFAHGGKYIIEFLYDSIEDLNGVLSEPINLNNAHRIDDGHFAGSEQAFRYWDPIGEVPMECSKCHSAAGLPLFLKDRITISQPLANGFQCITCHNDLTTFSRYPVANVEFPSGAVIDSGDANMNLCMTCHQGRQATVLINKFIKGLDDDRVYSILRFQNIHYLAAGATYFGTQAKGGYEYGDKTYVGLFEHTPDFRSCTDCHSAHTLKVNVGACESCHAEVKNLGDLKNIRMSPADYDGDGDVKEGIAGEIETMRGALYDAIHAYAEHISGTPIAYDALNYPHYFIDTNENNCVDADELRQDNWYKSWTPNLLRAAYNYQYSVKDTGAFAHNASYILQLVYDSLENLGAAADVSMNGMVRP